MLRLSRYYRMLRSIYIRRLAVWICRLGGWTSGVARTHAVESYVMSRIDIALPTQRLLLLLLLLLLMQIKTPSSNICRSTAQPFARCLWFRSRHSKTLQDNCSWTRDYPVTPTPRWVFKMLNDAKRTAVPELAMNTADPKPKSKPLTLTMPYTLNLSYSVVSQSASLSLGLFQLCCYRVGRVYSQLGYC